MTMIELPVIDGANLLTHSRVQTWKSCPRKHYFAYELGVRPAYQANPLRQGSAFHIGLEFLKAGCDEDKAIKVVLNSYADQECPPWMEADEFAVEIETTVALVRGWARRWGDDRICEYVAVELPFDLPIVNPATGHETPTFRSGGKIDGIARLPDGRLALVEHKTCGESIDLNSDYWRRLQMDSQISRYFLAARELGHDVQTTVYDVTRKPAISPKMVFKADRAQATAAGHYFGIKLIKECPERETPKMYGARLLDDMAKRPEFYFARVEVPRLQSDLDEYHAEAWSIQRTIRQAQLDARQFGAAAWPRNTAACLSMGKCPYFDHCKQGAISAQNIPQGFRRVTTLHEELVKQQEKSA